MISAVSPFQSFNYNSRRLFNAGKPLTLGNAIELLYVSQSHHAFLKSLAASSPGFHASQVVSASSLPWVNGLTARFESILSRMFKKFAREMLQLIIDYAKERISLAEAYALCPTLQPSVENTVAGSNIEIPQSADVCLEEVMVFHHGSELEVAPSEIITDQKGIHLYYRVKSDSTVYMFSTTRTHQISRLTLKPNPENRDMVADSSLSYQSPTTFQLILVCTAKKVDQIFLLYSVLENLDFYFRSNNSLQEEAVRLVEKKKPRCYLAVRIFMRQWRKVKEKTLRKGTDPVILPSCSHAMS